MSRLAGFSRCFGAAISEHPRTSRAVVSSSPGDVSEVAVSDRKGDDKTGPPTAGTGPGK